MSKKTIRSVVCSWIVLLALKKSAFTAAQGSYQHVALICELVLNDIMFEPNSGDVTERDEFFACHPVEDETGYVSPLMYILEGLNESLYQECRKRLINNENVFVSVPGGQFTKDKVIVPDPSSIEIVDHEAATRRKRELQSRKKSLGTFKILMLRIIARDSEPTFTAAQLYNLTFQDEISLKGQMGRCSAGKLDIEPTEYGVLDVEIDMDITGISYGEAVNAAYEVAPSLVKENVQDVRELVDAVMVVVPPGSTGSWAAFGTLNGKHSSYNDKWAGYIGATMHEVGYVSCLFYTAR
jgi:hypothetical protein